MFSHTLLFLSSSISTQLVTKTKIEKKTIVHNKVTNRACVFFVSILDSIRYLHFFFSFLRLIPKRAIFAYFKKEAWLKNDFSLSQWEGLPFWIGSFWVSFSRLIFLKVNFTIFLCFFRFKLKCKHDCFVYITRKYLLCTDVKWFNLTFFDAQKTSKLFKKNLKISFFLEKRFWWDSYWQFTPIFSE